MVRSGRIDAPAALAPWAGQGGEQALACHNPLSGRYLQCVVPPVRFRHALWPLPEVLIVPAVLAEAARVVGAALLMPCVTSVQAEAQNSNRAA